MKPEGETPGETKPEGNPGGTTGGKPNLMSYAGNSNNARTGATLLNRASIPSLVLFSAVQDAAFEAGKTGNKGEAARIMAAAAGASVTAPASAQRDVLRDQLLRIRSHAEESDLLSDVGKTSAWVAAEGDFRELDSDGNESGYKLNSWGGSVGVDTRLKSATVGLAITALYGDLDANSADSASGSLDSYWLNLYLRTAPTKAWRHTVVLTVGITSADLDRTVSYGEAAYFTRGSSDGYGLGALYELARDFSLNETKSHVFQPYVNAALIYSSMSGWSEFCADGMGLSVGDQDVTLARLGLGLRWIYAASSSITNSELRTELAAGFAQDFGDKRSEANVAFAANPGVTGSIYGAEEGQSSLQLDASLALPVTDSTLIYANAHGDLRSGAYSWSVGLGVRHAF